MQSTVKNSKEGTQRKFYDSNFSCISLSIKIKLNFPDVYSCNHFSLLLWAGQQGSGFGSFQLPLVLGEAAVCRAGGSGSRTCGAVSCHTHTAPVRKPSEEACPSRHLFLESRLRWDQEPQPSRLPWAPSCSCEPASFCRASFPREGQNPMASRVCCSEPV